MKAANSDIYSCHRRSEGRWRERNVAFSHLRLKIEAGSRGWKSHRKCLRYDEFVWKWLLFWWRSARRAETEPPAGREGICKLSCETRAERTGAFKLEYRARIAHRKDLLLFWKLKITISMDGHSGNWLFDIFEGGAVTKIYSLNSDKRAEKRAAAGSATVRGNEQNVAPPGKSKRSKPNFQ